MKPDLVDRLKSQIEELTAERERIDQAIKSLDDARRSVEGLELSQRELPLRTSAVSQETGITLLDAVKRTCLSMIDGITRTRVLSAIEVEYPFLKPVSSSVSAALINLARGDNPLLKIGTEGRGRSPTVYSTDGTTEIKLMADEIAALMDPDMTKGSGGWQSLWRSFQQALDKSTGVITLTPQLRARIYHYYHSYGGGGWQNKSKQVFRRSIPHIFKP